jgi:hypothetical protein
MAAKASVRECLESVAGQAGGVAGYLCVAKAGSPEAAIAAEIGPCLSVEGDVLVPDLWADGIRATRSVWVAVTTAQSVPDPNWIESLIALLEDGIDAAGGPIEPGTASPIETAVHFLRYSPYLLPFEQRKVRDVPGDNAVYRRSAIEAVSAAWPGGFWENEVNSAMILNGATLVLDPRPIVRHRYSGGIGAFMRQRYRHGIVYGVSRSKNGRWRAALAPAVPAIFIARILRRIHGRPDLRSRFLPSLPALLLFLCTWTAGETVGLLRGRS